MKIKKKYQDKEIQYAPVKNTIHNQTFEIKREKFENIGIYIYIKK